MTTATQAKAKEVVSIQSFLAVADSKLADTGLLNADKASTAADRRAARAAKAAEIAAKKPAATVTATKAKTAKGKKTDKIAKTDSAIQPQPIDDGLDSTTAIPVKAEVVPSQREIRPGVFLTVPSEATIAPAIKALPAAVKVEKTEEKTVEKPAAKKSAKTRSNKSKAVESTPVTTPKAEKVKTEKPATPVKPAIDHVKMIRPSSAPSEKVKLEDGKTKKIKLASYTIEAKEKVSVIATDTKIFHIFTAMSVEGGATLEEISTACGVSMTESYTINRVTMRGYGVCKTTDDKGVNRFSLVLPAGFKTFRTR